MNFIPSFIYIFRSDLSNVNKRKYTWLTVPNQCSNGTVTWTFDRCATMLVDGVSTPNRCSIEVKLVVNRREHDDHDRQRDRHRQRRPPGRSCATSGWSASSRSPATKTRRRCSRPSQARSTTTRGSITQSFGRDISSAALKAIARDTAQDRLSGLVGPGPRPRRGGTRSPFFTGCLKRQQFIASFLGMEFFTRM